MPPTPPNPTLPPLPPEQAARAVRRPAGPRDAWHDPESFATTLVTLFVDRFGTGALSWAPETARMEVADAAGGHVPPANFDRLMAGIVVVTTDRFYKNLHDFIHLANVLSGDAFDPTTFEPADAADCAWGITEALLLGPPEDDDAEPFVDDVRHYLWHVLDAEGFLKAPDVLRLALGPDRYQQASNDWADDPQLWGDVQKNQAQKTDEINALVRDGLGRLLAQVEALPLTHGDATDLRQRLRGEIQQRRRQR